MLVMTMVMISRMLVMAMTIAKERTRLALDD